MDLNKEIRRAVDTGKVSFGYDSCKKIVLAGNGKLVVVASNLEQNRKETLNQLVQVEGKKLIEYPGTGLELGSVCGKPFVVSAMIVLEEGKSIIVEGK